MPSNSPPFSSASGALTAQRGAGATDRQEPVSLLDQLGMTLLVTPKGAPTIGQHLTYIERLVARGGPAPGRYAEFEQWLRHVAEETRAERLSEGELRAIRDAFGPALSLETNQGLGLRKPHGYPGDFEILDRIYSRHITDDPLLRNWDLYFHEQAAPQAVRNRKAYFVRFLTALVGATRGTGPIPVLNVASGPARDVAEFFQVSGDTRAVVECVDADPNALAYAREVCRPYLDRVTFTEANALRYATDRRFRVIWSAGLFDYFGDKGFKFLIERLLGLLDDEGELVVGNFARANPSRDYMEVIGDWNLYYRDEDELRALAEACGVAAEDVRVGSEPSGVNLFLHIKRGPRFVAR